MSERFDAFHLPPGVPIAVTETLRAGGLECRYPVPDAAMLAVTLERLREAGRELVERPVAEIVEVLDASAARLADPGDPLRRNALRLLAEATAYSPAMARLVLDGMCADWRGDALRRLIRQELGDAAALDRFVPAGTGRRSRAYGPRLAFHIFAGNVPGVAVTSMIRSLLVKGPVLGKLAAGEPVLPVLFARAVAATDETLGRALAVTYWPGGEEDAETPVLEAADLVVVYGGEAVVRSVRGRAPAGTRVVVHGPRFSAGLVTASALEADGGALARAVARATAIFDQHGCVSPHAVWLEDPDGSRAAPFAHAVARAMEQLERELPRGGVGPGEASLIQQERGAAELAGHAGRGVRVLAGAGTSWTIVLTDDAAFRPSCLNRFLRLHVVGRLDDAFAALAAAGPHLQSVAVAARPDELEALAHRLARIGASRVTSFHRLPWPPAEWHHDGSGPLAEMIRWVDLEGEEPGT